MISFNSLKSYVYINGLVVGISLIEFNITNTYTNIYLNFFITLFVFLSRNYILINFIGYNLRNKETSYDSRICEYKEDYKHEFLVNLLSSSTIETGTYLLIKNVLFSSSYNITAVDFLLFIPKSFIFEVIFDFCHYSSHRILHTNKFLYINIHKKHHKFSYPIPILTFYQDPLDLIITNSIPQFISLIVFPHISLFQFNIILTYKSFIEISGHTSKKLYPNGSFSQFIWLPRFLNISLYTEDHTAHHVNNNCNYSKRFSLWDKVFGTYVESYDIANK